MVWRLLGMRGEADRKLQNIYETELACLSALVEPTALVRSIRADEVPALGDARLSVPEAELFAGNKEVRVPGTEFLAVLLTAGADGESRVRELFAAGEHLRGLLADALLSAWLFAMDEALTEQLRGWCQEAGVGISARLEAPGDMPMEVQGLICARLGSEGRVGVRANESGMLLPEKSMCYLLKADLDCGRFQVCHDCARCGKLDCGMRESVC